NLGDGTFRDATAGSGLGAPHWTTSATLFDADRDGDLDLYAAGYVDFQVANHRPCRDPAPGGEPIESYCHPEAYEGLPDLFYRNEGDGTFTDATEAAGFAGPRLAGLGVVAGDLDGDGYPEVYVANDADPNLLFANRGVGEDGQVRFEDVSLLSGTAYGQGGKAEGGMGVEMADADGDGRPDLFVTNFEIETNAFYRNLGAGLFNDARFASGIAAGSLPSLAFGTVFGDFDLDGDPDLAIANGHILDNAAEINPRSTYAQRNQVYENVTPGAPGGAQPRFEERTDTGLDEVRVSRGLAHGDLDLDGDLDLVVVNSNDRADAYENVSEAAGGWLTVALRGGEGGGGGETHGVGARLELETGEGETARRQVKEVRTASSYLSQNDLPVHFGLPAGAETARLTVRRPDGTVQVLEGVEPGARLVVE
ncbi:MAG TPA: CRTAC1 family protein, partial [Thermoanaerobaculia bacterium]